MLGNIGPMQLLIIFLIVLLIFGTKKLRNVGGDLGSAIRDFRKGMSSEDEQKEKEKETEGASSEKSTSEKSASSESDDDSGKSKS